MILLTADWHLSTRHKSVPIDWARNRFRMLFKQIKQIDCSLHIISGDIFDKVPNLEELELYFEFVRSARGRTLVGTGNHEATKKGKTFLTNLKEVTTALNPLVSIVDEVYTEDDWTIVPYGYIHRKEIWDAIDTPIVFSHLRGAIEPHVKPEIPLEWLAKFTTAYVGDLHSKDNCQLNLVYPGSPLTTGYHRHLVDTGYVLIDEEDHNKWTWHKFELPQLIRKTITDPADMLEDPYHRIIYELEGSVVDLSGIKNTELLDKKLVRRNTDTTLILNKDMTIEQELVEYFKYVLELPENQIQEALKAFHDNVTTA